MNHRWWLAPLLLLAFLSSSPALAEAEGLRRHALLVSANDGGAGRVQLRYARRDAEAVAKVLAELGGVDPADVVHVDQATVAKLKDGLAELKRRVARASTAGRRQEVVFYYSGHSDEEGLLLGGERLSYSQLRKLVSELPVDVRLMILDSCASGQLTVSKGGVKRAPFLVDSSVRAKGQAVITSASADEAAQESARIQGSFFTHYLVSGLRGAADSNGDGRVTLSEAYQYAYANTLARTETTRGGAQHPSYDFQLAGTGDLVLTDLRSSPATLSFPKALDGRYFVRDASGNLVAEIRKLPGQPVHLGLEKGSYTVTRGLGGKYAEATADLAGKDEVDVGSLAFQPVEGEPAVARGSAREGDGKPGGGRDYREKRFSFQLVPSFADDAPEAGEEHQFAFGLVGGRSGKLHGMSLALGGYLVDEGGVDGGMVALGLNWDKGPLSGVQVAYLGNYAQGPVDGGQIGLINWGAGRVSGAQVGVIDWASSSASGVQLGVLAFAGGPVTGAQVGSVAVAKGDVGGAQIGYVDVALGRVTGAQVGMVAYARNGVEGAQVGMVSYAPDVEGGQVGLVNVAKTVSGPQVGLTDVASEATVQVGLVNVATKATRAQVGLVNYADQVDDFSLGLVSYAGNGTLDVEAWLDELGFAHATLRMGSKHVYTLYDYGDRSWAGAGVPSRRRQTAGLGLGAHVDLGALSLGLELAGNNVQDSSVKGQPNSYATLRALVGYRVLSRLELYGGPDLGYHPRPRSEFSSDLGGSFHGRAFGNGADTRWVGYAAGVRWHFKS